MRDRTTQRHLVQLQHENDALLIKLARLGPAVRNLASELATSRRDLKAKEQEIALLQAENAWLRTVRPSAPRNGAPHRQPLATRVSPQGQAPTPRTETIGDRDRRQIERDLHDGAQQRLIILRTQLARAEDLVRTDPDQGVDRLHALGADVDEILDEIRSLAQGIYPSLLDHSGLAKALRQAVRSLPLMNSFKADGIGRHEPEVEGALYFTVLEALQNASKHAGARHVTVSLIENRHLRFVVKDDGVGFDVGTTTPGSGISNMRDRLAAVGGRLQIDSTPGRGTTVSGHVPLRPTGLSPSLE